MKVFHLKKRDEVVATFTCEQAQPGKNQWMVQLRTKGELVATIFLGLEVSFGEADAADKSSLAST